MKKVSIVVLSSLLVIASLGAHAATEVPVRASQIVSGHISVSGANSLDELTAALSEKADAAGADKFSVTSAGGKNKLHGTAVLLK